VPRPGRCRLPTPTAHQPRPSAFSDPDYLDRPGSAPRRPPPITDSAGPDFSFLPTPFPPGTLANARAYTKRLFLLSFAQSIFPAGQHKRPASNTEASAERGEGGGMALGDAGSRPPTRRDRGGTVMAGAVRPHTANGARPASARSIDDELASPTKSQLRRAMVCQFQSLWQNRFSTCKGSTRMIPPRGILPC